MCCGLRLPPAVAYVSNRPSVRRNSLHTIAEKFLIARLTISREQNINYSIGAEQGALVVTKNIEGAMNKDYKYWLRWFVVLPGSLLAGLLATFPLHWILYFLFNREETEFGSVKFFIQLFGHELSYKDIEYTLYPFVIAITFILAGFKIAPKYKFKTAIVLFIIYTIVWFISIFAILFLKVKGIEFSFSARTIIALLGAAIGLYIASRMNKDK